MPGRSGRGKGGGGGGGGGSKQPAELAALEAELQAKAGSPEGGTRLAILTACRQAVVERGGVPSCATYTSALLGSLASGGDEDLTQNVMFLLGHVLLNLPEAMHRAKFEVIFMNTPILLPFHLSPFDSGTIKYIPTHQYKIIPPFVPQKPTFCPAGHCLGRARCHGQVSRQRRRGSSWSARAVHLHPDPRGCCLGEPSDDEGHPVPACTRRRSAPQDQEGGAEHDPDSYR